MANDHRTRAQRQAEAALAKVDAIRADDKLRDDYKSRADSFPVMVMQAGLAQAVGFMQAKRNDKQAYGRYIDDLAAVLGQHDGAVLQKTAISAPLPEYRRLTRETLAVAGWFKRFGQAYLGAKANQEPKP